MPSTWSRREPLIPFDAKLNRTSIRMDNQKNPTNIRDEAFQQPPLPIEAHNQGHAENQLNNALRVQHRSPRP